MRLGPFVKAALAGLMLAGALTKPALADEMRRPSGAAAIQAQLSHAECYCRAEGRKFAVGESACLRTSAGPQMAECGMVLNNTSWRFTERPCPES